MLLSIPHVPIDTQFMQRFFLNVIQGSDEVWYVDVLIFLFYPIVAIFSVPHLYAFLILVAFHFSCFFPCPMSYKAFDFL